MALRPYLLGLLLSSGLSALCASARAERIEGTVVEASSRWGYGGKVLVTESVVEDPLGGRHYLHQLGGSLDGVGMRVTHSPLPLRLGDKIIAEASPARLAARPALRNLDRIIHHSPFVAEETEAKGELGGEFSRSVTSRTEVPVYWASGCALIYIDNLGSNQLSGDQEFSIVQEVADTWNEAISDCSYFNLVVEGRIDYEVGSDGINLIKFRENTWCRPAIGDDPEKCHNQTAAGIAFLSFVDDSGSSRNGELLDVDIEINGVNFAISNDGQTLGTANCLADFANTLTHELGHLMGLEHTCWPGQGPRQFDDAGRPAPLCSEAGPAFTEPTMYNIQACGETKKTTPENDDIRGICTIYPSQQDPNECKPANLDTGGCCSVTGNSPPPASGHWIFFGALGLFFLGLRRSRA